VTKFEADGCPADQLHSWAKYIVGLESLPRRFVRSLSAGKRLALFKYVHALWLRVNDNLSVRRVPRPAWLPKRYA
jgi:hypothetical protein